MGGRSIWVIGHERWHYSIMFGRIPLPAWRIPNVPTAGKYRKRKLVRDVNGAELPNTVA
jgi:hypothetical protein